MTLAKNTKKETAMLGFSSPEDWKNIVHDLKLSKTQERELEISIRHVLADIGSYQVVKNKLPSREELVAALKRMEKALGCLQCELKSSANLTEHFLPSGTTEYIGRSLTFSAIGEALGRDVFPEKFDLPLQRMIKSRKVAGRRHPRTGGADHPQTSAGERVRRRTWRATKRSDQHGYDLPSLEDLSQPMRKTLGLKHGHLILAHFIDQVYAPLKKWVALDKLNKRGHPPNLFRQYIIRRLAERSVSIVGKPATTTPTGEFAELCIAVLPACGFDSTGIEEAVAAVLGKMKGQKR